jgi:hypothetical protein
MTKIQKNIALGDLYYVRVLSYLAVRIYIY